MAKQPRDSAGVMIPPPLVYAAFFAAGMYASRWMWRPDLTRPLIWSGSLLALSSGALALWAFSALIGAKTTISPFHTTTSLVETGPFRFSRNPLYLSLTLLHAGFALLFQATGALITLPLALAAIHCCVIAREERYLESKFGDSYRDYLRRVRRWV